MLSKNDLKKINDYLWEIPKNYRIGMRVPARIFASEKMLLEILSDRSCDQLINVTTLPGILKAAIMMPDAHEGYGFPIGGVAATAYPDGAISPGGIGYDINCGVRLLKSETSVKDIKPHLQKLSSELYRQIPSGVGHSGSLKLGVDKLDKILDEGVPRIIKEGFGEEKDLKNLESSGFIENADPSCVSDHAKKRGRDQLGTMGAGNHFVEIDSVEEIFEESTAKSFGLFKNQVVFLIHTGSRGLGHQTATDHIRIMNKAMTKYEISLPDRELACAPFSSPEGTSYFNAMAAAANFAFANRQMITWEVRQVWKNILRSAGGELSILYDVAHNIAKIETHKIENKNEKVIVHRKGATRSFDKQPVIIPGSMGSNSYVLIGMENAMLESFGSTCHGAGRRMSRHQAKKEIQGRELLSNLEKMGIYVKTGSVADLAEEAPLAYKDIHDVVDVVHKAGLARRVARLKPLVVVKG